MQGVQFKAEAAHRTYINSLQGVCFIAGFLDAERTHHCCLANDDAVRFTVLSLSTVLKILPVQLLCVWV
jgi:hypothetical protein